MVGEISSLVFRRDINGLRAIAVLAVIVFHFNAAWLPGGFAGVDVFFVISGFLMTKIIFEGMEKKTFSLLSFYRSRALRIIPALTATCILCIIIGWAFLSPKDYFSLSEDVFSSMTFLSNFLYLSRTGYFDNSAQNNLLLHTWSLSVEWQFYIVYPWLIMLLCKITTIENVKKTLLPITVSLFLFSCFATFKWASEAYFMFPTRAWEMTIGGVAYLHSFKFLKNNSKVTEMIGIALILSSYIFIDKNTPWPGYMSIVPVLGTVLVIQSHRVTSILTTSWVQQKVGSISYSVYLVHWPIIVFFKKINVELNFLLYITLTVSLSLFTYNFFEKIKSISVKKVVTFSAVLLAAWQVRANNGFENRVSKEFRLSASAFHQKYYGGAGYTPNKISLLNTTDEYDYIVFGDSLAGQYMMAFDETGKKIAALYDHGCPILPNYSRYILNKEDETCSVEYAKIQYLMNKSKTSPVFIIHSWDGYQKEIIKRNSSQPSTAVGMEHFKIIINELEEIIKQGGGARAYNIVLRPAMEKSSAFDCLSNNNLPGYKLLGKCNSTQPQEKIEFNEILADHFRDRSNVNIIDPNDTLCENGECITVIKNQPVYSDPYHLSVFGAAYVMKHFFQ